MRCFFIPMSLTKEYNLSDMGKLLWQAGLFLSQEALSQIWYYHKLLRKANPSLNLTRIHNFEKMVRKHYIDSLIVHSILKKNNLNFVSPLLDIGSGAGLPGIPLAIHLPHINFILAESRGQRSEFIQTSVQAIGLKNVSVHGHRVARSSCPVVKSVITRALEKMRFTLERVENGIEKSGFVIFMKGPECDLEIEDAKNSSYPFRLILDYAYTLPKSQDHRRLVVWQRNYTSTFASLSKNKTDDANNTVDIKAIIINSRSNSRFRLIYCLRYSRYVKKYGQSLICGEKLVLEFLQKYPKSIQALIAPESFSGNEGLSFIENKILFKNELFFDLDFMGTSFPLLLVNVSPLEEWSPKKFNYNHNTQPLDIASTQKKIPITLFLPLGNPENLGAALRCCAAFDVETVVLLEEASHPYHPRAIRAAAGYCFDLSLYQSPKIADFSRMIVSNQKTLFLGLDTEGEDLATIELSSHVSLFVGSEGQGFRGFPSDLATLNYTKVTIPIEKKVDSLNASVALGIALYILSKRLKI